MLRTFSITTFTALLLAGSASAQLNNQWVEFELGQDLGSAAYNGGDEADAAWGDVDKDGDIDLVVVVKQDFTSTGKRRNKLFLNNNGVLVDATNTFVTASDVPGDLGFNTPTNDRDVVLTDVDVDGWLDIVTATTLSDGDPKHIGHPRIYRNLAGATWAGFRHEDSRIPQMFHFGNGSAQNPRFCSVAFGDVTGNNAPDLYFGDYDSGPGASASKDLNDRLFINDGNGFFTDQSQARMTTQMLKSAFGNSVEIEDFNLDGVADILKDTSLNSPLYVAISFNDPSNVGVFNVFDSFHSFAPYHTTKGDLNNDGRMDVIISDDNLDRHRYNLSTGQFGIVNWSSAKTYNFLSGGDDGFGSNDLVADLDGDGWKDTLHCDVDVDIPGYGRRLHIYHNLNTVPGGQGTIREEREFSGNNEGPGWLGVVGLTNADLEGMHDVAVFDIDGDNDNDIILFQGGNPGAASSRMRVFRNKTNGGPACPTPTSYGTGELGTNGNTATIGFLGQNTVGNNFRVTVSGLQPNNGGLFFTGTTQGNATVSWGTLFVSGTVIRSPIVTDGVGFAQVVIPVISSMVGTTNTFQFMARDTAAGNAQGSDALSVTWCN